MERTNQSIDYKIPVRLSGKMSKLDFEGIIYLHKGEYDAAESVFKKQLAILMEEQKREGHRIHKGAPLHNIGLCLWLKESSTESMRFLGAAFVDDVLSFGLREFSSYPASRLLVEIGMDPETLRKLAERILGIYKIPGEVLDPLGVFEVSEGRVSLTGLVFWSVSRRFELLEEEAVEVVKSPSMIVVQKVAENLKKIGGSDSDRVFIGGSYRNIALLRHISRMVAAKGKIPVLICDLPVKFSLRESHDGSMEMLEHCLYAVFEVSFPNGHMMEIERCHDIKKRRHIDVLMTWQKGKWSGSTDASIPSKMLITKDFEICQYTRFGGLSNRIAGFLE